MMTYKVIKYFTDLQDGNHPYNVGDDYPREGLTVTAERIAELSGNNNALHTPLIQAATMPENAAEEVETVNYTPDEQNAVDGTEKPSKRKGVKKSADSRHDAVDGDVQQPE